MESKQVYVVEDIAWLRELLTQFLSMQPGLGVCGGAGSAAEALASLPAEADAVTVDLTLGAGMEGLDLVRALRERRPDLPCIVLSGRSAEQMEAAAREAGAAAYVEKGNEQLLVETLYRLLGITDGLHS